MQKLETYRGADVFDNGGGVAFVVRGETFHTDDVEKAQGQIDGILDRDLATLPDDMAPVLEAAGVDLDVDGKRLEIAAALRAYVARLEGLAGPAA